MAFKTVTDLSADVTISLGGKDKKTGKLNPTTIEGYYLGKRVIADTKKKSGKSYIYIFQTPTGNKGVWGKTDLDNKMLEVTPGTMTRASFLKMVPTKNGDMYRYKVEVDVDNTIEVSAVEVEDTGSDYLETDSTTNSEEEQLEEETAEVDEEAEATAALVAQERQARTQAILAKAKLGKKV